MECKLQYGNVDVGQQFFEALEHNIIQIPVNDLGKKGGSIKVIQAEYQADSVLASRSVNKESDMIFSSDSGPQCLGINLYNYSTGGKNSGLDSIEVFVADCSMLDVICDALHMMPDDNKPIK